MIPVILAGGGGSRLWPKSRQAMPKQFLPLTSENSMLQETLLRLNNYPTDNPIIICNEAHRFVVAEQLRQIDQQHSGIVLEPVGCNTAPAIALAALQAIAAGEDPILLVLPADHLIKDTTAFYHAIQKAESLAQAGYLVTFGIVPQTPHTGYGYIRAGSEAGEGFRVEEFIEKPAIDKAARFVGAGNYFWNSGMFVFRASRYLEELSKFCPTIHDVCRDAISCATQDLDFIRVDRDLFSRCPADSVDYAVMENTTRAAMVALDAGWSDVGSWSSLWEAGTKDADGNVMLGDATQYRVKNSYINAQSRLVSVIGLDDVVVVETKDAVLVANKEAAEEIKQVVNNLQTESRPELEFHREVYRPWGSYDVLDSGARFLVKRVLVRPGESLSLQYHHHRAEHWVVVSGTARVTLDGQTRTMNENESVYIPIGTVHALENPGEVPLELIEVQSGSYLGEDDIVRLSDKYGREAAGKPAKK
ncbi:mannose-1-phosphate guanylyltransferase/mannose-6-phosphate isomerase [Alteromonas sp. CYL-A6]|uniref:mannose-1-phosphate guanylyltransferase/mannose-6-phosphate isomerase n=1 Tax=Alteromonas nitratireducens TaxID=3390813 RepID=UPI0034B857E0